MKRLTCILLIIVAFLGMAINEAYASSRVVVRQGMDLVIVFSGKNTKYIIKDDINLEGKRVAVGEGSVLVFKGGSLSNGSIYGTNTRVKAKNYDIFKRGYTRYRACILAGAKPSAPPTLLKEYHNCLFIEGTWNNKKCGSNWTGLINDLDEDIMPALRNYIVLHKAGAKVTIPHIDALGYESTSIPGGHQIDFGNSIISYPDSLRVWEDKHISLPASATPNPLESGYGLLSLANNTKISNLTIDGKSTSRSNEQIRLGVSCIISIGNAQNVELENVNINNVLGPGMTAQAGAKNITFKNCRFYNIGEHILYSHQYLGYCHFEGCTFDTWDSERLSLFRDGMNYVYKYDPPYDATSISYDEIYRFDIQFNHCTFNNPRRENSEGRVLGGFITGVFPLVVRLNDCKFMGEYPPFNVGAGLDLSEKIGKNSQMIVNNCNGAPYVYSTPSNCNIITEFYNCINIPFRTTYAKRYENCCLFLDHYESSIENVSDTFLDEFSKPLMLYNCELIDKGSGTMVNHPVLHRPIVFEKCIFKRDKDVNRISELVYIQGEVSSVSFIECDIELSGYRLLGGNIELKYFAIKNSKVKALESKYATVKLRYVDLENNAIAEPLQDTFK